MELGDKIGGSENKETRIEVEETKKNGKLVIIEFLKAIEEMINSFILKIKKLYFNICSFLKSKLFDKREVESV